MSKKYQIIYADPPWHYNDRRNTHTRFCGGAMSHYTTMKQDELMKLPVGEITDTNCILFLWATFPNLQEALDVIRAWGFTYKTLGWSWIKLNKNSKTPFFGIGYYTKSNCEVCLIATKGHPKVINNSISSVILSPRREHSRKPDEIKGAITMLMGDLPRIELFARQKTPGWDVWGNEVDSDIELIPKQPQQAKAGEE